MFRQSDLNTPPRPDPEAIKSAAVEIDRNPIYLRSYLLTRSIIGLLGLALPVVLIVTDCWLDGLRIRGSLSAYYHSGARDVFVGTLFMTGIFLVAYKVFSHTRENTLSSVAGIAALGVALFPSGLPKAEQDRLTPLQQTLHESVTTAIHFASAFTFIGLLSVICCLFARREGQRAEQNDPFWRSRRSANFWRTFHFTCAGVIAAAIVFVAATKALGVWQSHSLLVGEVIAVVAFGVSWLAKGSELRKLWPLKASGVGDPMPQSEPPQADGSPSGDQSS
jgi:hypothetical protein